MSFSLLASNVLVTDGDSLTSTPGAGGTSAWPTLLTLTKTWTIHDVAQSGQTLATCLANAPTVVDPFYDPLATQNVVVIWAGTNDITSNAANVSAVYANLVSYVAARHAVGWQVIVVTMLTKGNPSSTDTARGAYNALIVANSAQADAVVNFAGTPIGIDGGASNLTYFQADFLHPAQTAINTIEVPAFNTSINGIAAPAPVFIFVQSSSGNGAGTPFSRSFTTNTTAKNVLVAMAWCANTASITSFGDGVNTWAQIGSGLTPTGFKANVYVCNSAVGGPVTATLVLSGAGNLGIGLLEYSGPFKTVPVFQSIAGTGSSTSPSIGPLTTTNTRNALVAIIFHAGFGGTHTPEAGWQFRLDMTDAVFSEDTLAVVPGSYTATATFPNGAWSGMLLDFQPALILDTVSNSVPRSAVLYGRSPSGILSAITTDGSGNLNLSGSTSSVDTIGNSISTPVMLYGHAPNGQLQAVTMDGNGNLNG